MKIELEEPFKSLWDKGYLTINGEGRRIVTLHKPGASSGTSYARYLMGVKLGYLVPDHLEVDHKDDDKTNDDINNLQILTKQENLLKQTWNYIENHQVCYGCECIYCGTRFILTQRQVNMRLAANGEELFCSRSCAGKWQSINCEKSVTRGIDQAAINEIKRLSSLGYSCYKIASLIGLSKSTVTKYW
jgi:hypothetical protein